MKKTRIKLEVHVNLDSIPGAFHSKESARDAVASILVHAIPHYDPLVSTTDVAIEYDAKDL